MVDGDIMAKKRKTNGKYKCPECDFRSNKTRAIILHYRKVHGGKITSDEIKNSNAAETPKPKSDVEEEVKPVEDVEPQPTKVEDDSGDKVQFFVPNMKKDIEKEPEGEVITPDAPEESPTPENESPEEEPAEPEPSEVEINDDKFFSPKPHKIADHTSKDGVVSWAQEQPVRDDGVRRWDLIIQGLPLKDMQKIMMLGKYLAERGLIDVVHPATVIKYSLNFLHLEIKVSYLEEMHGISRDDIYLLMSIIPYKQLLGMETAEIITTLNRIKQMNK